LLEGGDGVAADLASRFAGHFASLSTRSFLATDAWRQHREAVYDDMYARCVTAVAGQAPEQPLSAMLTPDISAAMTPGARLALREAVAARLGAGARTDDFAAAILDFLARGQRIVAEAEIIQADTAALLHRPAPAHRLTLAQLNLHNVLMGEDIRTVPFLPAELAVLFDVDIHVDAESITISRRPAAAASSHSPGTQPGGYSVLVH
jgi:hypothetical protein